ncbi:MAG: hypothetical protein WEA34_01385 [Gemmatimonadota bacterium]
MRTHGHATLLTTSLMVAALGAFHIARPVAVSAQASASLTVSATVVRSDAAWSGHEMSRALLHSVTSTRSEATDGTAIIDDAIERDGTIAWVEPTPRSPSEPTVTVAHVGS